jgi:hypothetical protein
VGSEHLGADSDDFSDHEGWWAFQAWVLLCESCVWLCE